jgi:hypothetical protein
MRVDSWPLRSSESGPALEAFWDDDGSGFYFRVHGVRTVQLAMVAVHWPPLLPLSHVRLRPFGRGVRP